MKDFQNYLAEATAADSMKSNDFQLDRAISKTFKQSQTHVAQANMKSWMFRGDPAISNMRVFPKQTTPSDLVDMLSDDKSYTLRKVFAHERKLRDAIEKIVDNEKLFNALVADVENGIDPEFSFVDPDKKIEASRTDLKNAEKTLDASYGFRMWDVLEDGHLSKARTFFAFVGYGKFSEFNGIYLWAGTTLNKYATLREV